MLLLAQLHDAYRAAVTETGATGLSGAQTLLVIIGGGNANALVRLVLEGGLTVDRARLENVMQDGAELAHGLLTGRAPTDIDLHTSHINWLNNFVDRTQCRGGIARPGSGQSAKLSSVDITKSSHSSRPDPTSYAKALIAALTLGGAALAFFVFRKSLMYRKSVVERLPRSPVTATFPLKIIDADTNHDMVDVTAVDISAGGMKIRWPDNNASQGTKIALSLPSGTHQAMVMWSNDFFAGIMFDEHLSEAELEAITDGS